MAAAVAVPNVVERIAGHQSMTRKKTRSRGNSVRKKNVKCFKKLLTNSMI